MKLPETFLHLIRTHTLTRTRTLLALAVAAVADGLQLFLGPFGWVFIDQVIDVVAMALTMGILGFHILLLPTFVVEFIPLADMLPTWTGCVVAVITLRKREQNTLPPAPPNKPAIDI